MGGEQGEAKGREIGHPLSDLANAWAFLIPGEVNEGHPYVGWDGALSNVSIAPRSYGWKDNCCLYHMLPKGLTPPSLLGFLYPVMYPVTSDLV